MSRRNIYLLAFMSSFLLLGGAYYLQYVTGLKPCALCTVQRIFYYVIAFISILAFIINPKNIGQKIIAIIASIMAFLGVLIAGRQVWLQHFPPRNVGCGPNLDFMLHNFPLSQIIKTLFYGTGDCALVTWRFIELSLAEWSLIIFCGYLAIFLYLLLKAK